MVHSVGRSPSAHAHNFALTPSIHIERSSFDRSHGMKTTFNEGYLIPIFCDEVLPGDTFNLRVHALCRMATPIYPVMDNLYLETFFFFVPNRLVWSNWEQFNGQQATPSSSTSFILPTLTSGGTGFLLNSLADYFGLPVASGAAITVQSLPFRCYNLIYNEWFRDENLQNSVTVETDNGPDTLANYTVLQRGKRFDYFTSCLPWPQKINDGTVVEIPLGTSAPVVTTGVAPTFNYGTLTNEAIVAVSGTGVLAVAPPSGNQDLVFGVTTGLQANLSSATAATINQLRQAFQLQVLFERDARGGTRYTEIIRSHFGVISPDMRLQRPEVLSTGSSRINVNPVAQTAPSDVSGSGEQLSPQGTLAAFALGHINGHGFTKSFTEHGYIIGLINVRADLTYWQGINKMWSRSTRYDFYWPALAHIGEQTVLNQEIYATGTSTDTQVFGYQERYAEYRYKPSLVTSYFRPNASGTLDAWHLAQNFGSLPTLGSTFIVEAAPMSRVEAVTNVADFICDLWFDLKCARPMPMYGTPMQLGRF